MPKCFWAAICQKENPGLIPSRSAVKVTVITSDYIHNLLLGLKYHDQIRVCGANP